MKTIGFKIIVIFGVATLLTSCTSVMSTTASKSNADDLYGTHDRKAIAKQEYDREVKLVAIREQIALDDIVSAGEDGYYSEEILSDSYEDSYQRRLRGFSSLSYKMPSSYYDFAYSSKAFQVSGYDPSFYNVIVMGDEVWVEPRYVTSMFGSWGRPVNVNINLGFSGRWGWYSPYWDWHTPSWGWGGYPSYGWGYPSYGWGNPHYGWGNPHYGWGGNHGHYPGHYPGGGRYDSNVVSGGRRPGMMGSANGSNGGTVSGGGSGNRVTHTPNGTIITRRGNNGTTPSIGTGTYSPSNGSSGGSSNGTTVYRRRNSGTVTEQPTYNGSQNNNNTNQNVRPNQNQNQNQNSTYQRRSTTTTPSYNSGGGSYGGGNGGSVSGGGSGSSSGSSGGGSYRRR